MAMSFVHPSRKWANISIFIGGGRISPPHQANKFTHGCALEHIVIPFYPLPSY
jgi:hypothetical protein